MDIEEGVYVDQTDEHFSMLVKMVEDGKECIKQWEREYEELKRENSRLRDRIEELEEALQRSLQGCSR